MRQSIFILRKLSRYGLLCLVFVVWFCLLSQFSYAADQVSPPSVSSSSTVPPRLDSVVVTATRSEAKATEVPAAVTILNADDITFSGALSVDDLLRQIPGFNTFRRSSSLVTAPTQDEEAQGVTLRGIGPGGASRALVLVDGIPVNDAFGGWLYWGELPLHDIDRIEVVRGGNSHLWGNFALGGVINILTKAPEKQAISATVLGGNRGTSDATFSLSDVRGPLRYRLSGDFFRTDGWNIIVPRQRGPIDQNSDSAHKTLNGSLEYRLSPALSFFLRGSYYDEVRNAGTPLRISATNRGVISGGATLHTTDGSHWQFVLFSHLTRFREHFSRVSDDRTTESPSQHQVVPSTDVGGSFTWNRSVFTSHQFTAGTDFRLVEGKTRDVFFASTNATVTNRQLSRGQQHFLGFFMQDVYSPSPRLSVALGVRVDFFRNFAGHVVDTPTNTNTSTTRRSLSHSHTVFSPRLSFRYQLWPGVDLRGAGYQAFRAPTLAELYRQSSVEGLVLRENPRLRPEFLEGGEVGVAYTGLTGLSAHLTAYWNYLRRPITNAATARDPVTGEDLERTRVNLGRARIRGIEASLAYQVTPSWSIVTDYLYSEARVLDNHADPDLEGKRLTQVPWFSGTVGVRYQDPSGLGFLVQGRFEGKKFEDADNHETLGGYYVIDSVLSWPLPSHWLYSSLQGRVFLAVQNILDRDYIVDRGGDIFKLGTPLLAHGGMQLQF